MLSNAYFLAEFRFDTAENEPVKNLQKFANFPNFAKSCGSAQPCLQVDKLLNEAQDKLPDDVDFEEWIAAVEGLQSAIAKVNELSYTASFGEYNPGGGKAQVRKFLLLAKEQVVVTKDTLDTMIKLLKL